MQKKKWIFLALVLVIPGLMFSVSCQKKLVDASPEPMAKEEPKEEVVVKEDENSDTTVTIEGHCDARGTNEYNLALGDRRAESAKAFLVDLGISASRLTT